MVNLLKPNTALYREETAQYSAMAAYHAAIKSKYEYSTVRRSFSVEPDPREPPRS
jgi:hypothetical protein